MTKEEYEKDYNNKEDKMILAILEFAEFTGMIIDVIEVENDEVMCERIEIDYKKCIVKIR